MTATEGQIRQAESMIRLLTQYIREKHNGHARHAIAEAVHMLATQLCEMPDAGMPSREPPNHIRSQSEIYAVAEDGVKRALERNQS